MTTIDCIATDELRRYCLGQVPPDRGGQILAHLETCERCEDTVAALDDTTDSLLDLLRCPRVASEADAASELGRVIQHVKQVNPCAAQDLPDEDQHGPPVVRIQQYELLEMLGSGGMGTVYKARHTGLERIVALKLLAPGRLRSGEAVARFQREMKAIGKLDHPVIVRATDAGEDDGIHYLAMEWIDGIDLSQLVRISGPLRVADACEIARQVALGLQHLQQQDLVHRDIKPSNVMVSPDGRVRILDLGLARIGEQPPAADELTTVGQLMGTLDYVAPEQCLDGHEVDIRADIYGLGATLFKLLAGTAPYQTTKRRSLLSRLKALATDPAPSIKSRRDDLPSELVNVVDRMLARLPADRMQTPAEVATALAPFSREQTVAESVAAVMKHKPKPEPLNAVPGVPTSQRVATMSNTRPDKPEPLELSGAVDSGRYRKWWYGCAAFFVIACAGVAAAVIHIKTDVGELVVECAEPGVKVLIQREDKNHKQWKLEWGTNRTTLRTGNYKIVLNQKADGLLVEGEQFRLQRGGEWVATIKRKRGATPPTASSPRSSPRSSQAPNVARYNDKTFDEWKQRRNERNPERLTEFFRALGTLASEETAAEAASLLLDTAPRFIVAWPRVQRANGSADHRLAVAAIEEMRVIGKNEPAFAVIRDRLRGSLAERRFLMAVLDPYVGRHPQLARQMVQRLVSELIDLTSDEDMVVRLAATRLIAHVMEDKHFYGLDGVEETIPDEIVSAVRARFRALLADGPAASITDVSAVLKAWDPEAAQRIAQRMQKELKRDAGNTRAFALMLEAAPSSSGEFQLIVPTLIRLLNAPRAWRLSPADSMAESADEGVSHRHAEAYIALQALREAGVRSQEFSAALEKLLRGYNVPPISSDEEEYRRDMPTFSERVASKVVATYADSAVDDKTALKVLNDLRLRDQRQQVRAAIDTAELKLQQTDEP